MIPVLEARERAEALLLPRAQLGFRDAVPRLLRDVTDRDRRAAPHRLDGLLCVPAAALDRLLRAELDRVLPDFVLAALLARELRAALERARVVVFDLAAADEVRLAAGLVLALVLAVVLVLDGLRLEARLDELRRALGELRRPVFRLAISISYART